MQRCRLAMRLPRAAEALDLAIEDIFESHPTTEYMA
jgi:hypothetical protein